MDPRILRVGSSGPQSGRFTQGTTRKDHEQTIREHSPWNLRWVESSPTSDSTPTQTRFILPGTGDILHATYLLIELNDVSVNVPIGLISLKKLHLEAKVIY